MAAQAPAEKEVDNVEMVLTLIVFLYLLSSPGIRPRRRNRRRRRRRGGIATTRS